MAKPITLTLDDEAAARLAEWAATPAEQGALVSRLIREAPAPGSEGESLRLQVLGLISEMQSVQARLLTLETAGE